MIGKRCWQKDLVSEIFCAIHLVDLKRLNVAIYIYNGTVEVRQSNQGKLVAATQVQSAEYLKPLFKQLRQRVS